MPLPLTSVISIAISAFLVGFSKTSVGSLGIVVVPLIALAVPGPESTGLLLPMLAMADVLAVIAYHRSCEWTVFRRIFPLTAIGVVIGYLIMDRLPRDIFGSILGALILFMLAVGWMLEKRPVSPTGNRIITWVVGICAGISTMVANAAGPLMGIYLLQQGLPQLVLPDAQSVQTAIFNPPRICHLVVAQDQFLRTPPHRHRRPHRCSGSEIHQCDNIQMDRPDRRYRVGHQAADGLKIQRSNVCRKIDQAEPLLWSKCQGSVA
ncbi:MAG: sulfite exporter TauE/SafE family protein [Desulfobacteraceae bacterium]